MRKSQKLLTILQILFVLFLILSNSSHSAPFAMEVSIHQFDNQTIINNDAQFDVPQSADKYISIRTYVPKIGGFKSEYLIFEGKS